MLRVLLGLLLPPPQIDPPCISLAGPQQRAACLGVLRGARALQLGQLQLGPPGTMVPMSLGPTKRWCHWGGNEEPLAQIWGVT